MPKERSAKQVYEQFSTDGLYEEANLDKDEVNKVLIMVLEDFHFGKERCKLKNPSWRVIFNINYDVFRELGGNSCLCSQIRDIPQSFEFWFQCPSQCSLHCSKWAVLKPDSFV